MNYSYSVTEYTFTDLPIPIFILMRLQSKLHSKSTQEFYKLIIYSSHLEKIIVGQLNVLIGHLRVFHILMPIVCAKNRESKVITTE